MRKKLLAANWKMNKTLPESIGLVQNILNQITYKDDIEVLLAPAFPLLVTVQGLIKDTPIKLGAQNVAHWSSGAFTGEVSAEILKSVGVETVIVGHSERRNYFLETSAQLIEKVKWSLQHQMQVIYCVGESEQVRQNGSPMQFINHQLEEVLSQIPPDQISELTIAYEPIWAIGSGQSATPSQIGEIHSGIRAYLTDKFGIEQAEAIRIIYGGSVNSHNAKEIFLVQNVDGALVGGASLDAVHFLAISQQL